VKTFVFASTNYVVGMYEEEYAPEIYSLDSDIRLDHTVPIRPDSYYGTSKTFGEHLTRYYVENYDYPKRGYSFESVTLAMPTKTTRMPDPNNPSKKANMSEEARSTNATSPE
jgi:nucleoside-diphosphate-sugar epimerase